MYHELRARLDRGETVLMDGAMGSELVRRGVRWRKHGLETDAGTVEALHAEYLSAGADVLRTNTFQLNPRLYLHVFRDLEHMRQIGAPGLEHLVPKLQKTAVGLAMSARAKAGKEGKVAIAGVLSPIEHCYRPDLSPPYDKALKEHQPMAEVFAAEKVDFLLAESMNTIHEAKAALAAGRAAKLPVWVSFVLGPEGELLSLEKLSDAVAEIEKGGAEAVLVSNAPLADITKAAGRLKSRALCAAELEVRFSSTVHRDGIVPAGAVPGRGEAVEGSGGADRGRLLRHDAGAHPGVARVAGKERKELR